MTFTILTLALVTAAAEPNSSWYEQCSNGSNECFSYIQGIYEVTKWNAGKNGHKPLCGTETFKAPDVAWNVIAFLNIPGNSGAKQIPFSVLVASEIEYEFQCKQ